MFTKPFQTRELRRQALTLMMEAGATLPQDSQRPSAGLCTSASPSV